MTKLLIVERAGVPQACQTISYDAIGHHGDGVPLACFLYAMTHSHSQLSQRRSGT